MLRTSAGGQSGDRRRRAPSKDVILRVAAELFDRVGYHAVSMEQLAGELGISKPTLYVHVDSKPAIMRGIVDQWIGECDAALEVALDEPTASRRLQSFLRSWTAIAIRDSAHARVFEYARKEIPAEAERYDEWSRQTFRTIRQVIRSGQASGEFRRDRNATVVTFMLFGVLTSTSRWYREHGPLTAAEIADEYWLVYGSGLLRGAGH